MFFPFLPSQLINGCTEILFDVQSQKQCQMMKVELHFIDSSDILLGVIFRSPLWSAAPNNLQMETLLSSRKILNIIKLVFVVLEEPQMHGV